MISGWFFQSNVVMDTELPFASLILQCHREIRGFATERQLAINSIEQPRVNDAWSFTPLWRSNGSQQVPPCSSLPSMLLVLTSHVPPSVGMWTGSTFAHYCATLLHAAAGGQTCADGKPKLLMDSAPQLKPQLLHPLLACCRSPPF